MYPTIFRILWLGSQVLDDVMKKSGNTPKIHSGGKDFDFPRGILKSKKHKIWFLL